MATTTPTRRRWAAAYRNQPSQGATERQAGGANEASAQQSYQPGRFAKRIPQLRRALTRLQPGRTHARRPMQCIRRTRATRRYAAFVHPAAPRAAHYALAHRVIPGLVFRNPMIAVALHLEAEGTTAHDRSFVDSFVRAANRTANDDAPIEDGSVRLSSALIEGHAAAVFHFPPPQHTTEAFFSAVVQGFEFANPPRNRARVAPRYFVLEHSTDRPAPHTVLTGWSPEGTHFNFGPGPAPTKQAFLDAVAARLRTRDKRRSDD